MYCQTCWKAAVTANLLALEAEGALPLSTETMQRITELLSKFEEAPGHAL